MPLRMGYNAHFLSRQKNWEVNFNHQSWNVIKFSSFHMLLKKFSKIEWEKFRTCYSLKVCFPMILPVRTVETLSLLLKSLFHEKPDRTGMKDNSFHINLDLLILLNLLTQISHLPKIALYQLVKWSVICLKHFAFLFIFQVFPCHTIVCSPFPF